MKTRSWLIYALGGGWGHLNRSLALARKVADRFPVTILTNTAYLQFIKDPIANSGLQIELVAIPADAGVEKVQAEVGRIVLERAFACLIVDTFPRGLAGELVPFLENHRQMPRILVHRDLNPNYVRSKRLQSFVMEQFDRILIPGEGDHGSDERSWQTRLPFSDLPQVFHTAPWLLRNYEELPDRTTARALLGLNSQSPLKGVLVMSPGRQEEWAWYGEVTRLLAEACSDAFVRCVSPLPPMGCPPELSVFHWPAIECLPAASVVVGGAGYNTFFECQALNSPLVVNPVSRLYDRQHTRVYRWLGLSPSWSLVPATAPEKVVEAVQSLLMGTYPTKPAFYENGVIEAARLIEEMVF